MDLQDVKDWASNPSEEVLVLPDPVARALLADIWEFCGTLAKMLDAIGPMAAAMMPQPQAEAFLAAQES